MPRNAVMQLLGEQLLTGGEQTPRCGTDMKTLEEHCKEEGESQLLLGIAKRLCAELSDHNDDCLNSSFPFNHPPPNSSP
ncbi:unnamed protein product [Lampetra planeri]